jgi:hypothetical protein
MLSDTAGAPPAAGPDARPRRLPGAAAACGDSAGCGASSAQADRTSHRAPAARRPAVLLHGSGTCGAPDSAATRPGDRLFPGLRGPPAEAAA